MPKNSGGGEDRAKVKLRVIEFELEGANSSVENSIRQLTAALTFRSNVAPPRTPPLKETREIAVGAPDDIQDAEVIEDADGTEGTGDLSTESKPAKQTKPKKFKSPEVVNDLDLTGTGGLTFKDFADQKAPPSKAMKYLVATSWLKEHGSSQTVNADKMYTCFKKAKWPTNFNDWAQTFHNLVHSKDLRKVGDAEFAINTTGEDRVNSGGA